MNFEEGFELLVRELREPDDSAADLAVKILLRQPEVAWREFDRRALEVKRSLISYLTPTARTFHEPDRRRLKSLESLMSPWFEANARSGVCRIRALEIESGWAFIVRHGDLVSRIGVITENGETMSALFRPERMDVLYFNRGTGESRISGPGRRLQDLYRAALGRVLHEDHNALRAFEPLHLGATALWPGCNRLRARRP